MSFGGSSAGSGCQAGRKTYEFGRTYVVRPKGKHQATIVWLHGLGDNGGSWSQILETLPLPNVRAEDLKFYHFVILTSSGFAQLLLLDPLAYLVVFHLLHNEPEIGHNVAAGFDVADLSEDSPDDEEGLDAAVAHVVNLLSTEPADIRLAVGGFSMGAATALHAGACYVLGKKLSNKLSENEASNRAAALPILLCHGKADDVVRYKFGEKSSKVLSSSGFNNVTFKSYDGLGHYTHPEEIQDICSWLKSKLNLDGQ
ncbi:hypothetical protein Cgig2_014270 [Carnegiea gigantea]|uniref:Phospholipase/carboxylesterase/thioesterase domain-containing protein n=1 Tax=Carnegiea gigantea TaxID=171969 RepID=A0A9Q1GNE5_9CARY|nr:hypothetical protein Cgig2_014270 [Carnegiea gigantea]